MMFPDPVQAVAAPSAFLFMAILGKAPPKGEIIASM